MKIRPYLEGRTYFQEGWRGPSLTWAWLIGVTVTPGRFPRLPSSAKAGYRVGRAERREISQESIQHSIDETCFYPLFPKCRSFWSPNLGLNLLLQYPPPPPLFSSPSFQFGHMLWPAGKPPGKCMLPVSLLLQPFSGRSSSYILHPLIPPLKGPYHWLLPCMITCLPVLEGLSHFLQKDLGWGWGKGKQGTWEKNYPGIDPKLIFLGNLMAGLLPVSLLEKVIFLVLIGELLSLFDLSLALLIP